jgi:hypothetical protein
MFYAAIYAFLFVNGGGVGLQNYLLVLTLCTSLAALVCCILLQTLPLPSCELVDKDSSSISMVELSNIASTDEEESDGTPLVDSPKTTSTSTSTSSTTPSVVNSAHANFSALTAMRTVDFWLLFAVLSLVNGSGNLWLTMQGLLAKQMETSIVLLVFELGLASIVGRIIVGILSDLFAERVRY